MDHSHPHLTAHDLSQSQLMQLQCTSWAVNYCPWGQAPWLSRKAHNGNKPTTAICLCPSLASDLSCFKDSALASDFVLLTGELLLSRPSPCHQLLSDRFLVLQLSPPQRASTWTAIRATTLHCSWHRERAAQPWRHTADSADTETTVVLFHNRRLSWTVYRQISSRYGLTPKLQKLKTYTWEMSISLPVGLMLWQAALSSISICLYFLLMQIPATSTNTTSTNPLLFQHFGTACSPQVTQTCKGKQIPQELLQCLGKWKHRIWGIKISFTSDTDFTLNLLKKAV